LTGLHKVRDERPIVVFDQGPERHGKFEVFAVPAVTQVSTAVLAIAGLPMRFPVVPQERSNRRISDETHVPASAAMTAVRPPSWFALAFLERSHARTAPTAASEQPN
jgi:hypothetical protein